MTLYRRLIAFFVCLLSLVCSRAQAPVVNSFLPVSGPVGTAVVLTGSGFSSAPGANIVYFGAVKATVTSASTTTLHVVAPNGATFQPLSVTTGGLTGYSNLPFLETFSPTGGTIIRSSFDNPMSVSTDLHPNGIVLVDLDGDGKPDMATPSDYSTAGQSASVSVLHNTSVVGSPSFASALNLPSGVLTDAIAAGDLNGDGKPDLVSASIVANVVSYFLNTSTPGAISFSARVDLPAGTNPAYVSVNDIDGDGRPDILVVNNLSGTLSVYRNTTVGAAVSFAARVDYTTGLSPTCLAVGDLDGDGKPDVAVTNNLSNTVSLFRNTSSSGTISFATRVDLSTTSGATNPYGIAIGDIDGDGKADLVIANNNLSPGYWYGPACCIYANGSSVGSFAFTLGTSFGSSNSANVAIGDLNGDGKPDIALPVVDANTNTNFQVWQNSSVPGNIAFGSDAEFNAGFAPYSPAIGDLDGNGIADMVVSNNSQSTVTVYRNKIKEPSITYFLPTGTAAGKIDTLIGTNFTGATAVSFGGVPAASFTVVSDNEIHAVVGSGASGAVRVTGPGGSVSDPGFVFMGPPVISGFSPVSAGQGQTVTIVGFNFNTTTAVSFGGVLASSFSVVSPDTITAVVGSGAGGSVGVTTTFGSVSTPGFGFIPLPLISSFSPGIAGVGETVTITGVNFTGATAVSFGGVAASSFTVVSPRTITAVVGSGASGAVSVTTAYGTEILPGFTWLAAPTISGISPTTGVYGTVVTVTGANFDAITAVSVGGVEYTYAYTYVSPTEITITLSASGDSGPVVVTTSGGSVSYPGFVFYRPPQPVYIQPTVAGTGMSVLITGTNLSGTTAVTLGGVPVSSFRVVSADTIVAVVGAGGSGEVIVTNPAGSNWEAPTFSYSTAPLVSGFTPDSGAAGTVVTITGGNFSGDDVVYFGTAKAIPTLVSAQQIVVSAPAGSTYGPVAVISPVHRQAGYCDHPFVVTFPGGATAFDDTSFVAHREFPVGAKPSDLAIGDIDGDGKSDLAVVNFDDGTVSVYRNTSTVGAISFASRVDIQVGTGARNINLADINSDGKLDIVVTMGNDDFCGGCGGTGVAVLRNLSSPGSLVFAAPAITSTLDRLDFVVVGDMDGDGKPDIVGADGTICIGCGGGYNLFLFDNKSVGDSIVFLEYAQVIGPSSPIAGGTVAGLALRDVNRDGKPDIVVGVEGGNYGIVLTNASNLGGGAYFQQSMYAAGYYTSNARDYPLVADLGGNGLPDIATSGNLFINGGVGNFGGQAFATIGGPGTVADLNGDGRPDLVRTGLAVGSTISLFKDSITASGVVLAGAAAVPALYTAKHVVAGDLDGDGKPELIASNKSLNSISIFGNRIGGPMVVLPPVIDSIGPTTAAAGTTVLLSGLNFTDATAVNFGTAPAGSYTVVSPTVIAAVVDTSTSDTIAMTTPAGVAMIAGFHFVGTPGIRVVGSVPLCAGQSVVLVGITRDSDVVYQWYRDSAVFAGSGTGSGLADSLEVDSAGSYAVAVSLGGVRSALSAAVVVVVNPMPAAPTISRRADSLVSSSVYGNNWYMDSTLLSATDTGRYFVPAGAGSYRVRVTAGGCSSDLSVPYAYSPVGDSTTGNRIQVTPNPTLDVVVVNFVPTAGNLAFVQVYDRYGRQLIFQPEVRNGEKIDLSGLANGVYMIKVLGSDGKLLGTKEVLKL